MTKDLIRAGIMEKRMFLCLAEKWSFGQKCILSQKIPENFKRLIFILETGTFFFAQLFLVVARTWCPLRSELFWGPHGGWITKGSMEQCDTKMQKTSQG